MAKNTGKVSEFCHSSKGGTLFTAEADYAANPGS